MPVAARLPWIICATARIMLFSTWPFLFLFLPITVGVFFLIPERHRALRKGWLVGASLFFYGYWKVSFLPLILISVGLNYGAAEGLCRWQDPVRRRWLLAAGVAVNLVLLGYFKYANFLLHLLGLVLHQKTGHFDILLPLAISFFTFTQISYVVDVYRNRQLHHRFLDYSLFVTFFPHLIAGPIVRHWEIIPQFADRDLRANRRDIGVGLALLLMGLFKKAILADQIAFVADAVFRGAENGVTLTMFDAWFGALAFAVQLYFDFSGYSDMAIGLARMFSIRFPSNFASPYQAGSPSEFWRRWHITLTRFLREYVYFPLGGNRCGRLRQMGNIMATMAISGLWHGAGLTFLAWGILHGALLVVEQQFRLWKEACGWKLDHWACRFASGGATFLAVLCGWVLFRAASFAGAGRVLASMAGLNGFTMPYLIGEARLHLGTIAEKLGATIVQSPLEGMSYSWSVHSLLFLLAVAWLAPNSQQLLAVYEPILEPVPVAAGNRRIRLRLNYATGLFLGVGLFWFARSFFTSQSTPFLYFNF